MSIAINAYQLRQPAEFAAPDCETDADQRDTAVCLEYLPADTFVDGEPRLEGLYVWLGCSAQPGLSAEAKTS